MHCNSCAVRVEGALTHSTGVVSAAVNLATAKAFVAYDPSAVAPETLCGAVERSGYAAAVVPRDGSGPQASPSDHWVARASGSWVLGAAAFALAMFGPETALIGWVVLALAIVVEIGGGWPFLRSSARLARHGTTNMDTLIALGTLAALAVSAVEAIALGGRHVHLGGGSAWAARLHGVMAPLIISIIATGRAVEERARERAARALHSLLSLRPPTARVVTSPEDDHGQLVPPESVPVGALVRVHAGETIPLDGSVVSGWSAVDESMLTGEPLPVDLGPSSLVTGGTRNGSGTLVVRVGTVASESVLTRLQKMVEEAQRDKAPLQRIADRISSVFVPVILLAAAVTFLAWWLAAGNFGTAVLSGIAVLLVACPCAMGLATPVAMMVGCGRASALGILIRGGDALEQLAKADTVAFDKTGTLTERAAEVTATATASTWHTTPAVMLALAAAVEAAIDHPIAAAIRAAALAEAGEGVPGTFVATDSRAVPGVGAEGLVEGRLVQVVRPDGASLPPELGSLVSERGQRGETVVIVKRDSEAIGAIAVATPLRPEAAGAVAHLHSMGLSATVLSGDSTPAVGTIAGELGIEDFTSALSPSGKLEALHQLQATGRRVMMVGDGINDAPALAAADVGCAVGSGTEAALASSDVALLGNDLEGVPAAIGIARSTLSVIQQNFGWAMGYNISALPLAAAGLLDPLIAAVAMGASSLVVVLNSLRLMRLGRSGLDQIRPPKVMRGARGWALSIALPVLLFGGATVIGQVVSPARGQPLLPSLPSITDVQVGNGVVAEVYLASGNAGVNAFHVVFVSGSNAVPANGVRATGSRDGGAPTSIRLATLSAGHYVGYSVFAAGTWVFTVHSVVGGRSVAFSVTRRLT